jgi:excisionase family DNA binding protein
MLEQPQLLTVGEVAFRLRQSERTVRDKIAAGDLPALKIGSGPRAPIRVDSAELERWLYGVPRSKDASAAAGSDAPLSRADGRPSPPAETRVVDRLGETR